MDKKLSHLCQAQRLITSTPYRLPGRLSKDCLNYYCDWHKVYHNRSHYIIFNLYILEYYNSYCTLNAKKATHHTQYSPSITHILFTHTYTHSSINTKFVILFGRSVMDCRLTTVYCNFIMLYSNITYYFKLFLPLLKYKIIKTHIFISLYHWLFLVLVHTIFLRIVCCKVELLIYLASHSSILYGHLLSSTSVVHDNEKTLYYLRLFKTICGISWYGYLFLYFIDG